MIIGYGVVVEAKPKQSNEDSDEEYENKTSDELLEEIEKYINITYPEEYVVHQPSGWDEPLLLITSRRKYHISYDGYTTIEHDGLLLSKKEIRDLTDIAYEWDGETHFDKMVSLYYNT